MRREAVKRASREGRPLKDTLRKFGAKPFNSTYGVPLVGVSQRELVDRDNLFIQQCERAVLAGRYFLWEHPEAGSTWTMNQCDLGLSQADSVAFKFV